jgi:predicted tellurium resistance membrane protein TerC
LLRLPLVHAGPAGNASSLLHAVQLMVLADVAMSLDNILALAWRHTQHTLA